MSTDRLESERTFHDRVFDENTREPAGRFYAIEGPSQRFYEGVLREGAGQRDVLEYGCGPGSSAFLLAEASDRVTGIDLSPVAIDQARERAAARGLAELAHFQVMNAEQLELESASFDLVCGSAILHHLDLERAYGELARVLKPGGKAVFLEPLGHNPVINLYRRRTPGFRTNDEHPLLEPDVKVADRFFEDTELHFFHLTTLLAVPARGRSRFASLVDLLGQLDGAIFRRVPAARKHAWMVGMVLRSPRPATG